MNTEPNLNKQLDAHRDFLEQIAAPFPIRDLHSGIRVLAPTGSIGYVPKEQLEEALEAGAKVLTPDDMREMRQEIFMQHGIFKEAHERPSKPRKRRSIVRSSRRSR